jgi:UPF0755 protein
MMAKYLKLSIALLFLMAIAVAVYSWSEYERFSSDTLKVDSEGTVFVIQAGSNLQKVSKQINQSGLSDLPALYLSLYGRLKNNAHLIKAGEYLIQPDMTLPEVLDLFISGDVVQYSFTIIEGMTAQQLIDIVIADQRLLKTLPDNSLKTVMALLGHANNHGEGEFLPETYYFTAGMTDIMLLKRAHKSMTEVLETAWKNKADNLPYKTPYEALIMASIIEKESGIAEERPQIAGVFVRRLQKRMRLQTDPTVIYGMGDSYKGNIRRKDLRTDTPYNTYTRSGLPPTPIALPSKEAIEAALHPLAGKSLYFVATGKEGRHVFSNNLKAHNAAVRKYQLKK